MRILFWLSIFLVLTYNSCGQTRKGFDLSNATIPVKQIKDGGPPKDGIPSIDNPKFITAEQANLDDNARVLGVKFNKVIKAYPISIMNYHEIVNDQFAKHPVVITYCPLCSSGIAFDALINKKPHTFGVSGLIYNSDVLLYDRQSESLWSQIMMKAVAGAKVREELVMLPTSNTTWQSWKKKHPNTMVLSKETGYRRNYASNPYPEYNESAQLYFEVNITDSRFHPKETVVGIAVDGKFKAYPFSELAKAGKGKIEDQLNGKNLIIAFDKKNQSATVYNKEREEIPGLTTFWFAWYAFHPETEVWMIKNQ